MADTRQRRQGPRSSGIASGSDQADKDGLIKDHVQPPNRRNKSVSLFLSVIFVALSSVIICYFMFCPVKQRELENYRLKFVKWWNPDSDQSVDSNMFVPTDDNANSGFPTPSAEKLSKVHDWMKGPSSNPKLKLMNNDDVKYVSGGKLYLIIIGHVIDVTSGAKMYEPGSGYHGFIGRDSSRAFVSGEFNEKGLIDDIEGLEPQDYLGLADWIKFYLTHEKYKFVGYHIGSFFDSNGKETEKMAKFKKWVKHAKKADAKEQDLKKLFPSCNVEWTQETGSKLWCSSMSGGIDRDWVGFPRQFFEKADKPPRCACVHPNYLADPRVKVYEDCAINAESCRLKPDKK